MNSQVIADQIYRAAIGATASFVTQAPTDHESICGLLAATLNERGTAVRCIDAENSLLAVGGGDGIMVAIQGEDAPDSSGLLARHNWQRVHVVTVGRRMVHIKTVAL